MSKLNDQRDGTLRLTMLIVYLCCLLSFNNFVPATAQENQPVPIAFAQMDTGIHLYALTSDDTLESEGRLPDDFGSSAWQLAGWSGYNLVLSPDGQSIAFTARKETQTGLFIYMPSTGAIEQGFAADYGDWNFHLQWSPDSTAILLRPEAAVSYDFSQPSPEIMVYEVGSGQLQDISNNPDYVEFYAAWSPDSQHIIYTTRGTQAGMILVSRDGQTEQQLLNFEADRPTTSHKNACRYQWSDTEQRWYYVSDCLRMVDDPRDELHSIDLNGQTHIEALVPDLLLAEFGTTNPSPYVEDVYISEILPTARGVFAAFAFKTLVEENDEPGERLIEKIFWRVMRVDAPGQVETVFEYAPPNSFSVDLAQAAFSPDHQKVALVSDAHVVVGDLLSGEQVADVTRQLSPYTQRQNVTWIDSDQLLYADDLDIWKLDIADGTADNLTTDIDEQVWLLPQINS